MYFALCLVLIKEIGNSPGHDLSSDGVKVHSPSASERQIRVVEPVGSTRTVQVDGVLSIF